MAHVYLWGAQGEQRVLLIYNPSSPDAGNLNHGPPEGGRCIDASSGHIAYAR
jgi:hypothetical protein